MQSVLDNFLHEFQTPFTNSVLIFAVILFIILLVPIIFNRFRIPGIIGLIASGMIIGPNGFDLLKKNSAVDLFATIGLLYIMFIAGLELDLAEFKKNKNKSLVFGLLTFAIPLALGVPACHYLLGYELDASLLTASMFATHTLIAYPIVTRLGISKTQAVAVAVGGTILTDTAVLLLLAIISGSHASGLTNSFWTTLVISVTIFTLVVVFVVPRVSSWFFRRLEDEKYAHFIFVLSVVFFCAFIAELAGLEPIIGAFAAGLTLNRLIPHNSSLMNRIEFVGNSLFIPFFLISVGMLIDIKVLTNGPQAVIVAAVLSVVALLSKWIAAHLTGFAFNYSKPEREIIFGLSSAHAAATLAVILVGYNIGLIDDNILNGTVVLILVTCVVASFATERAGKNLLLQQDSEPERPLTAQRILVPIANPETMERLIDFATTLKHHSDRLPIVALTVVKDDDQAQHKLLQSKKLLDKAIVHASAADQQIEITSTIDRNVTNGIIRVIKEKFITDIVLGWSSQNNLADLIFGRTYDSIVKQTSQTVFITRFVIALNIQQNMVVVCPPFADKEKGFLKWLDAILNVGFHLRMKTWFYCTPDVSQAIRGYVESSKVQTEVAYKAAVSYDDLSGLVESFDMVVFVSSREGGISYNAVLDTLPRKMSRTFKEHNLVFVYPSTHSDNSISTYEHEVTGGILEKGLNILRGAKKVFTKDA